MARSKSYTSAKRNRYISEGRGQGEGSAYKPWNQVVGTHSKGRVARVMGVKISRIHHFFNDLQRNFFYWLEWNHKIVDLREHYPLQRHYTLNIANTLGLRHPVDTNTGIFVDLTVEFFLTIRLESGVNRYVALSVISNKNRAPKHKLQIIQRYFEERNVEWRMLTAKDLDITAAKNFEWCRIDYCKACEPVILREYLLQLNELQYKCHKNSTIIQAALNVANDMHITHEESVSILKHLLATKALLPLDDKVLFSHATLADFNLAPPINLIEGQHNAC